MTERVNKLYKPAELQAAIKALETNTYNPLPESEARAYVKALHAAGWRVVYVGTVNETLDRHRSAD